MKKGLDVFDPSSPHPAGVLRFSAMQTCSGCGHAEVACTCNLTFAQKVRGTQIAVSVLETRTRHRYFDHDSLDSTFGVDHREEYWEETDGLGAMHKTDKGFEYRDHRGNRKVATNDQLDAMFGPEMEPTADDFD